MNLQPESVQVEGRKIRLRDLTLAVFTVAVILASLRGVGSVLVDLPTTLLDLFPFRSTRTVTLPPQVDPYRVFAIGLVAIGVGLMVMLITGLTRRRHELVGVIWRALAIAVLAFFLQRESDLLSPVSTSMKLGGWAGHSRQEMELKVVSFSLAVAMVGILLCLQPSRRSGENPDRAGISLAAVLRPLGASIVGLALLTGFAGLILYLVLIAIEAVRNALRFPGAMSLAMLENRRLGSLARDMVPLQTRIDQAALVALGVLVCGLATAIWLGIDLRSRREQLNVAPRAFRMLSVVLTGIGAAWLVAFEFPRVQPALVEGLVVTIWPVSASAVLGGFLCLSLGLSAQGTAPARIQDGREADVHPPRKPLRTIVRGLAGLLLAYLTLGAFSIIWPNYLDGPWIRGGIGSLQAWMDPGSYFASSINPMLEPWYSLMRLESCMLWGVLAYLGVAMLRQAFGPGEVGALDVVFRQRGMTVRLLGRATALIVLIMAVFPVFLMLSVELMHYIAIMTA